MSDLGTMVSRIREDLNRGTDFDPRIKRAICDAIKFYKSRRLGFNIKQATAVLTSGNEYVALPTDWVEVDHLRLETDTYRRPLDEVTFDWIEDNNTSPTLDGEPIKFSIHNRRLRFYPVPDRSYTLVMSFQYELKNVSISASDGETNAWVDECEELIRKHAMAELYVLYIDGPESFAKGTMMRRQCIDEIAPEFEAAAAREQSSGKIQSFI
jgi:hypothetical protein